MPPAASTILPFRPTAFLVLHPATADALVARIDELFAARGSLGPGPRPAVRVVASPRAPRPDPGILVATADHHAWLALAGMPDAPHFAYVRPELAMVRAVLPFPWPDGSAEAAAWSELLALDRLLCPLPQVMLEDVHAAGDLLWPALEAALGLPPGPRPASAARAALPDYDAALAALMPPLSLGEALRATRRRLQTGRHTVRAGAEGLSLLGSGWSSPEADFVWSERPVATLRLPEGEPGRALLCRLHGTLLRRPGRGAGLTAWAGDAPSVHGTVAAHGSPDLVLDVPLPLAAEAAEGLQVTLRFDAPVRPCDIGGGADERLLALALAGIEVLDAPDPPPPASPPRVPVSASPAASGTALDDPLVGEAVRRLRPRLALVLAARLEAGLAAAATLRALGVDAVVLSRALADPAVAAILVPLDAGDADPGVRLFRAGLPAMPAALDAAGLRVDLVVLCDDPQIAPFLDAARSPAGAAALSGAGIVAATGDPYGCGAAFFWHARALDGVIRFGPDVTTLLPAAG